MNYSIDSRFILRAPFKPFKSSFTPGELQTLFREKSIQEALFLSSPQLLQECKKWLNNELSDEKKEAVQYSLLKYALRLHTRCTPFGLFAGSNVTQLKAQNLYIDSELNRRNTKLDMTLAGNLANQISKLDYVRPYLKFYPNTSIYKIGDAYRYVESLITGSKIKHQIAALEYSIYIERVLALSKSGITIGDLAKALIDESITTEDAEEFILDCINSQLIVSELEPNVTGDEVLDQLVFKLSALENGNKQLTLLLKELTAIREELLRIDKNFENGLEAYENIIRKIENLAVPFERNRLFQSDLYINIQPGHTDSKETGVANALQKALKIFNILSPNYVNHNLKDFKEKFTQKYENQEVPLLHVMDNEFGIGYNKIGNNNGDDSPLINGLKSESINTTRDISWNHVQSLLLRKIIAAAKTNRYTIIINQEDVKDFPENWDNLPQTMSVLFSHLGKRDNRSQFHIMNIGNPSATNMLGRFGNGCAEIREIIVDIADFEEKQYAGSVIAEIAHLPENRLGNVMFRPAIRNYEIPYLANSCMPEERQIKVDDLMIAVRGDNIYLRSKSLNKLIVPRLGNAHNFSIKTLPVYQFLCEMQLQNLRPGLLFNWGIFEAEFTFLPRIEYDNLIISPATWIFNRKDYSELIQFSDDSEEFLLKEIAGWRNKHKIPELILLVHADNELLIDLKNLLSIKLFIATAKKYHGILLKEFLFCNEDNYVKDSHENFYTNEFLGILYKENAQRFSTPLPAPISADKDKTTNVQRTFIMGSEWVYYKIYCGYITADNIVKDVLLKLASKLLADQFITDWFFIRYADPDPHLRVRFHASDSSNFGKIIEVVNAAVHDLVSTGCVWKLQMDTYEREIERYGRSNYRCTESIFNIDSEYVCKLFALSPSSEEVWLLAMRSVDDLLSQFKLTLTEKCGLIAKLKTGFAKEFPLTKQSKLDMDKFYREKRKLIHQAGQSDNAWPTEEIKRIIDLKNAQLIEPINAIRRNYRSDTSLPDYEQYLAALIHMSLNRLFRSKQRLNEMVLYDYLWREYKSDIAKTANKTDQQLV